MRIRHIASMATGHDRETLPTVGERSGGVAPEAPVMTFRRAPGIPSHPTITAVETMGGSMIVREADDGRLVVDVVFLATPHRLEIELDPSTATFAARWPLVPLFGAGLAPRLASLQVPPV